MLNKSKGKDAPDMSALPLGDAEDLELAIQHTLAILAALDARYEQELALLESWPGPEAVKERLSEQLAACHRRDRQPYTHQLAELHGRITERTMFSNIRQLH